MNAAASDATADLGMPAFVPQAPAAAEPVNLLLVTDTDVLGAGGSERFLRNLCRGLDPLRYRIDLVQLCAPGDAASPMEEYGNLRIEYRPIGSAWGRRARRVHRELAARLRRGDYDLVQSQHEKSDLICALLPRGPRHALRVSNRRDAGFQKSPRLRAAFRLIDHRFDRFVAPSRAVLEGLARDEGVAPELTRCVPNGVDTQHFQPLQPAAIDARRSQLGLPVGRYLIGCVARIVELKRHVDLVDAFARVAPAQPDADLVLAGTGPLEADLRTLVDAHGLGPRVHFLGERDDVEQLLPALDAFVLCSRTEGMPNAVLEAMACGLPVIATAVGGTPEVVDDGATGWLVPPCDPVRLAQALSDLLGTRERGVRMGIRARARALREFSIDAMLQRFDAFYAELIGDRAAR